MPSPFPGMDPYLEQSWTDVHVRLIAFIADALGPLMPPGLRARSEEEITVQSDDPHDPASVRPDVVVRTTRTAPLRRTPVPLGSAGPSVGLLVPDPVIVHIEREPATDKRVVISDRTSRRIITVIEVLSPANKAAGPKSDKYLRKLRLLRESGVGIVEIDLLRHPSRARMEVDQSHLPPEIAAPYLVGVCRASRPDDWEIYPISLRERVPPVPVPLRENDPDAVLDLQPLLDRIYTNGGYADDIDYSRPPDPPLSPEDAAWAADLLARRRPA